MRAVLDLDPFAAAPGAIAAIASLGDDPFKPHDTCLPEDDRAVCIRDVLRQAEAVLATIQKLGQQGASRVPALRAQIAAVQLQHNIFSAMSARTRAAITSSTVGIVFLSTTCSRR
jgi:hypothetical protein